MMDETPETEGRQCAGQGFIRTNDWPFGPTCPACNGMGYRPMTEDEEADAAEEQQRLMCEGEPTLPMKEAYDIEFRQQQESRTCAFTCSRQRLNERVGANERYNVV